MKYWIYKITDKNNNEEFYIGSANRLSSRKSHHKKNVHNKTSKKYWCKLYQYIRTNGGWENFEFEILENGNCEDTVGGSIINILGNSIESTLKSKQYIKYKEQEYINRLKPTLNTISAHKEKHN